MYPHQKSVGAGVIFCARSLLEEARSIKNIQAELNEFIKNTEIITKPEKPVVQESIFDLDPLQKLMRENDKKLPPEIRP